MSSNSPNGNGNSNTHSTSEATEPEGGGWNRSALAPEGGGKLIILTAPLTEAIDHAGYFIQMAMASLPIWMEWVLNKKYPNWRNVQHDADGSARYMPAGVGVLETALSREFSSDDIGVCYPDDLEKFVGPNTRVIAVSTHNPLGVTFAAGVYTSIFGSSKMPINSHYSRLLFAKIKESPYRKTLKVIVGGSGGWQIKQTNLYDELSVDCVVDGRAESADTMALFHKAIAQGELELDVTVDHPRSRDTILFPTRRTSFGVVEMTTGCGRRCNFCVPDLNPQLDLPKDKILEAVRVNVSKGNKQISLATEDMFIWGQVQTDTPFFFPNREALLDLFTASSSVPGVEQFGLSHSTIAPAVVDPIMIKQLSDAILDKSPIHLPTVSKHPKKKALVPLIGLETGSVRLAKKIMPSKGVPFPIDDWPSVIIEGLRVMNKNQWYPMMTLIIGSPGETDDDVKATLDLVYEIERRGHFAFLVPSVFTPLHDTRMEKEEGVTETQNLTPLQWQLIMKCWKNNLRPGQYSWWGPSAWRIGSLVMWLTKLRRTNGANFKWPLFMFAGLMPEEWMERMGKIYVGKPLKIKNRKELLASIRPSYWKYLREDCGDLPEGWPGPETKDQELKVVAG
jgi:hypothetical protein